MKLGSRPKVSHPRVLRETENGKGGIRAEKYRRSHRSPSGFRSALNAAIVSGGLLTIRSTPEHGNP